MSLYRLIDEESERQPVSLLCRTLGVTRSGFYEYRRQPLSDRKLADWLLTEQIRGVFDESEQTYGSPRVYRELKLGRGLQVAEKRVARLMRQARLVSIHAKKRKGSTTRQKEHPLAPDLAQRDFAVDAPDRLWVADFTQLTTWTGTAYIAVIADAYSRFCLGWSVRADKTVELVLEALDMAIWRRGQMQAAGAIHHSDQGSQYTSFAFTRRLAAEAIVPSMGTVGDALDNAMCESLIATMKIEKLNRRPWRSVEDVRAAAFHWIESWYNRRRRHSSLGYLSPLEYESQHHDGHPISNP
ncbi:MAG TPA: IS3 family transposase [Gaiellaceae bacterium]|nr:IS3 family transposase [Gaiellaceae bacterium]